MPNSTNAILSLPPRHARRIIGLGKDVSREQRARHQASLGEESPAPAEENEPGEEADVEAQKQSNRPLSLPATKPVRALGSF
jgi:hypothetical protein